MERLRHVESLLVAPTWKNLETVHTHLGEVAAILGSGSAPSESESGLWQQIRGLLRNIGHLLEQAAAIRQGWACRRFPELSGYTREARASALPAAGRFLAEG